MAKIYTVVKDGETIKELKTLAAAKKLADAEGGEVLCDGETIYTADSPTLPATSTPSTTPEPEEKTEELPEEAAEEEPKAEKYKLLSKMNIRIAPSLKADKVGVADTGTVVEVIAIENDWLRVKNGAGEVFILYGGGKFAERV